jgi:hypothetical protein
MAALIIFEVFNNALIGIVGLGIIAQDKRGFVIAALAMLHIKGQNCGEARAGGKCFEKCILLNHWVSIV